MILYLNCADVFRKENVSSVSDYGAGIGQYAVELKRAMPNLMYYGYDGAGDVETYTLGLLYWFDLTQPLNNPVTDWVMSLEVGEHIPSKYEGMFVRNLHMHNCKGIILSWGVIGQKGVNHINNHSNEYVSSIFDELGYKRDADLETLLRREDKDHRWFQKSVMVFRRKKPVCLMLSSVILPEANKSNKIVLKESNPQSSLMARDALTR